MSTLGECSEYIVGCSIHQKDIMILVGELIDKIHRFYMENPNLLIYPNLLMISPHMNHDVPG